MHTYIHTYVCMYTHTYIHTYIHTQLLNKREEEIFSMSPEEFVAAMHSVRLIGAKYDFATNTYESKY